MADESTTTTSTGGKNNMMIVIVLVVIVLVVGGFLVLSKKNSSQQMQVQETNSMAATSAPVASGAPTGAMTEDKNVQEVKVTGRNFAFDPTTITVKKGQKVRVVFTSSGGIHDFVLDEFNVKTNRVTDGQSDTVEFTPDKTGTFEYYCSVGNHRAMGMVGKLTVE